MFNTIDEAIEDIKNGKMVIVVDDENRENEGDLLMAAQMATPQSINFMATYGRGLICLPATEDKFRKVNLPLMVTKNTDTFQTAFTVTIDGINTSTGISAYERCETVKLFCNENCTIDNLKTPGHIFPLMAKNGGVLVRNGHTEASVDLARLAGFSPIGLICEIMKDDGTMARIDDLIKFKDIHNLKIITIKDLIKYRKKNELTIDEIASASLPTKYGEFKIIGYKDIYSSDEHVALVYGDINIDDALVRIHSECLTGDVFNSLKCDCGNQLNKSMEKIQQNGSGIIIYLRQEGRGIGLLNKIKAYQLQDKGYDTVEANLLLGFDEDLRDFYFAAQILKKLEVKNIKLISNNPEKFKQLQDYGINVKERISIKEDINNFNKKYLQTKKEKMGHILNII
ncbi:bifunctional 3,4-dihydroxy-2-butanone-4-phosphate synthase/GTP cyclohydrolase II [Romboutsia maritimum]|uniref:Riboflavin biosynthesis protein RibBA n=1 Tax=Romboutsia maritimum TaxID=2020948 RepID=A0A371ITG6_9FIRM|nr:bifunctional 3,4-dihydroxy-2-butanone-4-phosphate synthase/GTP cyclohydrolase II [Romboutsia maritimum]RDY23749.1 bifunctional 3,4-dihydroxy-2-butanone-4-phosphate synthase/GTP cyclohydrolase II [Romboutsia maritimum]